jgi:hypothetical protein
MPARQQLRLELRRESVEEGLDVPIRRSRQLLAEEAAAQVGEFFIARVELQDPVEARDDAFRGGRVAAWRAAMKSR